MANREILRISAEIDLKLIEIAELLVAESGFAVSVLLLLLSLLLVCFFYSIPRRSDRETTGIVNGNRKKP